MKRVSVPGAAALLNCLKPDIECPEMNRCTWCCHAKRALIGLEFDLEKLVRFLGMVYQFLHTRNTLAAAAGKKAATGKAEAAFSNFPELPEK